MVTDQENPASPDDEPLPQHTNPDAQATLMAGVPMDKLAKVYRKMSQKISEIEAAAEAEVSRIKEQRDTVKAALKDQMLVLGVSSVRTTEGTVVLSTKTRYNATDWDAFKEFIVENNAIDLLEKRIAQKNMGEWLEANPAKVPPGLNQFSEYDVSVRKPQAS
jgi:hypothetical protein